MWKGEIEKIHEKFFTKKLTDSINGYYCVPKIIRKVSRETTFKSNYVAFAVAKQSNEIMSWSSNRSVWIKSLMCALYCDRVRENTSHIESVLDFKAFKSWLRIQYYCEIAITLIQDMFTWFTR